MLMHLDFEGDLENIYTFITLMSNTSMLGVETSGNFEAETNAEVILGAMPPMVCWL